MQDTNATAVIPTTTKAPKAPKVAKTPKAPKAPKGDKPVNDVTVTVETPAGDPIPQPQPKAEPKVEMIAGFKIHPLASHWPMVEAGETYEALVSSIRDKGVLHAVIRDSKTGLIVDGRNRLAVHAKLAAEDAAWAKAHTVAVIDQEFADDGEVWEHIKALNKARRHLTPEQLVAITLLAGQYLEKAKANRAATQFKAGGKQDATAPKERKTAEEYRKSTAGGMIAADAGVGLHKGRQGATIAKGLESGVVTRNEVEQIAKGEKSLNEVVKKVEAANPPKPRKERTTPEQPKLPDLVSTGNKLVARSLTVTLVLEWLGACATASEISEVAQYLKDMGEM